MKLSTTSFARKILLSSAVFLSLTVIGMVARPQPAAALSGSQFQAGHIIDDSLFYNSSFMHTAEIQAFLNAKVPECDTDGSEIYSGSQTRAQYGTSRGIPPPYTCLRDYSQSIPGASPETYCPGTVSSGTKTAARIINEVSKACGINPQVLIVLLQKEQSLITDEWPFPNQYRSATGYGCPDTAPCDEQYYGFFNQVYQAARAYKRYRALPANYNYRAGRNNTVLWHPNSSCGSSQVFIQNNATAGLYIYTPYRPNQAALDNLYGSGNSCSSYGNRNFWRMFNDWFGSSEGTPFFRIGETAPVYILGSDNNYYHFPTYELLEAYGFPQNIDRIVTVDSSYVSGMTNAGTIPRTARFEDAAVYLMDLGRRRHFPSQELMEDTYGYALGAEATLPANLTYFFPEYSSVKTVLTEENGPAVYSVEGTQKRHVTEPDALLTGSPSYASLPQMSVSRNFINSLPSGQPIFATNRLLRIADGGNANRFWTGSTLQKVSSRAINLAGLNPDFVINTADLAGMSTSSSTVDLLAKDSGGQNYLLDSGRRWSVSSGQLSALGLTGSSFITAPDLLLGRISSASFTNLFRIDNGSAIYTISGGDLKHFLSWEAITERGFSASDLKTLSGTTASLFTNNGKVLLHSGMIIRPDGGAAVYMVGANNTKWYISSRAILEDMGLSLDQAVNVPAAAITDYTTAGTLSQAVKRPGGAVWLLYNGTDRRHIPANMLAAGVYNINTSGLAELPDTFIKRLKTQTNLTPVIQATGGRHVYFVQNGQKRYVSDWSRLDGTGYDQGDLVEVSPEYVNSLATGSDL